MTLLWCFGSALQGAELVHLWAFDGDTQDTSGSDNHGVVHDGEAEYVPGRFGQAIWLEKGAGVMAEEPSNLPTSGSDAWSMNIWLSLAKAPDKGAFIAGFTGRDVDSGDPYAAAGRERVLGNLFGRYWFWSNFIDVDSGRTFIADSAWHMYTVTYDGLTIVMYIDGVEAKRQARTLHDTEAQIFVGGTSLWDGQLAGAFDDFSIWRGALSSEEITGIMDEGALPDSVIDPATEVPFALDGIWITSAPTPLGNWLSKTLYVAQDAEKTRFSGTLEFLNVFPLLAEAFPDADPTLEVSAGGEAVRVGDNQYEATYLIYGRKLDSATGTIEIVHIEVLNARFEVLGPDYLQGQGSASYYVAAQDADQDGFPDDGQEPVACFPWSWTSRRLTSMPGCVPTSPTE